MARVHSRASYRDASVMSIFNKMLSVCGSDGGIIGYIRNGWFSTAFTEPLFQESTIGVTSDGYCAIALNDGGLFDGQVQILDKDFLCSHALDYSRRPFAFVDNFDNLLTRAANNPNRVFAHDFPSGTFLAGRAASLSAYSGDAFVNGQYSGSYFYYSDGTPTGTILSHNMSATQLRGRRNTWSTDTNGLGVVTRPSYTVAYGATAESNKISMLQMNLDFSSTLKSIGIPQSGNAAYLSFNPRFYSSSPLAHPTNQNIVYITTGASILKLDFTPSTPTVIGAICFSNSGGIHSSKMGKDGYIYLTWSPSTTNGVEVIRVDPETFAYTQWSITHSSYNSPLQADFDADSNGVIYGQCQFSDGASSYCSFLFRTTPEDFVSSIDALSSNVGGVISVNESTGVFTTGTLTTTTATTHGSDLDNSDQPTISSYPVDTTGLDGLILV